LRQHALDIGHEIGSVEQVSMYQRGEGLVAAAQAAAMPQHLAQQRRGAHREVEVAVRARVTARRWCR
jgi:hypothetical protein